MTKRPTKANNKRKDVPHTIMPLNPASLAFVRFMARLLAERDDELAVKTDELAQQTKPNSRSAK